jgi:NitT/TauT family transport system substrate-binding protein
MMRVLRGVYAACALTSLAAQAASDQDKITLMTGGIDKIIYLPAKLAEKLGYFTAQGLQVELRSQPAGIEAKDALLSSVVQGVIGFYDHTIALQAKGKAVQSVVQLAVSTGEAELVSARMADRIKSPADFRGRNLGVTGLGSSTSFLTRYLGALHSVRLSEVNIIPVGAGDTFIAAMKQGVIDAGMTTEPTISRLVKSGEAKILVDLRRPENVEKVLGGLYPASCLYMRTAWVDGHKSQVQKLVNALVGALVYIELHSAEEIASQMPVQYYAGDRRTYVRALTESRAIFTTDGRMPASGPATVLKVMSAIDPNVQSKNIDLAKTYTTEFVLAAEREFPMGARRSGEAH